MAGGIQVERYSGKVQLTLVWNTDSALRVGPNPLFESPDLYHTSSESDDLQYTSKVLNKAILVVCRWSDTRGRCS